MKELQKKALEIRKNVWQMIKKAQTGHTGSDLSCTDILVTLYYHVLNVDPKNPQTDDRDRYIQSKGHAVEVYWAILADKGFITKEELGTYSQYGSRLIGHPNNKVPGIEMNTGSLGHGLAVSVGIALAAKLDQKSYQTYTLLGDGELAEGSVWEGAMAAANYHLDNLTAIIDRNGLQITGKSEEVMSVEPLKEKWEAFGWQVLEVTDGNDIEELLTAFEIPYESGKPKMIIAHTVKGKGAAFAENVAAWHHKVPTDVQYEEVLEALNHQLEAIENDR